MTYLTAIEGDWDDDKPLPWSREGRKWEIAKKQAQLDALHLSNRAALKNLLSPLLTQNQDC